MAMKETSGGDSPLRQGAGKSFWTLPISGRRWRRIAMCFWKSDRVDDGGGSRYVSGKVIGCLGFSRRGVFIGEGAASKVDQGGHTTRGRGPALGRAAMWCGRPVTPLHLLFGLLEAPVNIWTSGFWFVQFREYFLCNFSETQKQ
jgi:hypothetical protein